MSDLFKYNQCIDNNILLKSKKTVDMSLSRATEDFYEDNGVDMEGILLSKLKGDVENSMLKYILDYSKRIYVKEEELEETLDKSISFSKSIVHNDRKRIYNFKNIEEYIKNDIFIYNYSIDCDIYIIFHENINLDIRHFFNKEVFENEVKYSMDVFYTNNYPQCLIIEVLNNDNPYSRSKYRKYKLEKILKKF